MSPVSTGVSAKTKRWANNTDFDYEFAFDVAILALPDDIRRSHHFEVINITMSGSQCFGSSLAWSLLPLGGLDTVVLNSVVSTVKRPGMLATAYGDYYSIPLSTIRPYSDVGGWIGFKLLVLVSSLLSFFLLSTCTALLVRVLISSGVVLLFPIFGLLQVVYEVFFSRL
jgi:hypothetical protein